MEKTETIYCSLDIETSGFDPLKDEILEVGFVLFRISSKQSAVSNQQFEIIEEWTRVFKPNGEVSHKILGLTGIKQAELDSAPKFSEFQSEIQAKLKDTVIVGHNVVFDIKFLESFGIKFSGFTVDTLDLVQWLLPTHHSYNLENLMHFFSISHKDAHRALADAKAALQVLQKLIGLYAAFPQRLKDQILSIAKAHNFIWQDLLPINILPQAGKILENPRKPKAAIKISEQLDLKNNTAYNFGLGEDYIALAINSLSAGRKKTCLAVPRRQLVVKLWEQGLVEPVFSQEDLFSESKFEEFLKKELSPDEAKFALKVLVWKETNWQINSLLDLNLTFFGGQFKSEVSGGENRFSKKAKVFCADFATFIENNEEILKYSQRAVLAGPAEFEVAVSSNLSQKVSWGSMLYLLKSIYNPEINAGKLEMAETVKQGLNATDLFFGLAQGLISKAGVQYADIKLDEEFVNSEAYAKIKAAAENYAERIFELNKMLELETLQLKAENLKAFFSEQENRVKWIEMAPGRLVFNNSPLEIGPVAQHVLKGFKEICFIGSAGTENIFKFFLKRLGLEKIKVLGHKPAKKLKDLFSKTSKIELKISAENFSAEKILLCLGAESLPGAVLFGSQLIVKDFFEAHYKDLQKYAFLLNQSLSGGSNKLLRNFSIHPNSLLLATDRFVLKSFSASSISGLVERLEVKTLILTKLPFEQFTHPYAQAVAAKFENPFEEYSLPRAVYALHKILSFFYSAKLRNLYILDSKLSKPYARAFYEYFESNPNLGSYKLVK